MSYAKFTKRMLKKLHKTDENPNEVIELFCKALQKQKLIKIWKSKTTEVEYMMPTSNENVNEKFLKCPMTIRDLSKFL